MRQPRIAPLALGLGGAALASLCCAAPAVLVALGLMTSSLLLAWISLKPVFLALAAMFLVGGLGLSLVRSKKSCSRSGIRRRLALYPFATALSFAIAYWLLMDVGTPQLVQSVNAAAVARGQAVREPNGTVVSLRRAVFHIYYGCDGCALGLLTVIRGLPGVHAAEAHPQPATVVVFYDPSRISARTIKAKIPYLWYFKPHLQHDTPLAVVSVAARPLDQPGIVVALFTCLLALTSAVLWFPIRRQGGGVHTR